jgi:hypothetical protein
MSNGGRILIIESVIQPDTATCFSKFMDLAMLVMTGGRERTRLNTGLCSGAPVSNSHALSQPARRASSRHSAYEPKSRPQPREGGTGSEMSRV